MRDHLSSPAARVADLVVTETRTETIVYDTLRHHIHHLNEPTSKIWRLCDGHRTVAAMGFDSGMSDDSVRLALTKLEASNLLAGALAPGIRTEGSSRRSFVKKMGAGAVIPAIVSISAPTAAMASSHEPDCTISGSYETGCGCAMNIHCASRQCVYDATVQLKLCI